MKWGPKMAKVTRWCTALFRLDATTNFNNITGRYDVHPFQISGTRNKSGLWQPNLARVNACTNGKRCLTAAWANRDSGEVPDPCKGSGYNFPSSPGLGGGRLDYVLASRVISTGLVATGSAVNESARLTIKVSGYITGDNGCGCRRYKNNTSFPLGEIRVRLHAWPNVESVSSS